MAVKAIGGQDYLGGMGLKAENPGSRRLRGMICAVSRLHQ